MHRNKIIREINRAIEDIIRSYEHEPVNTKKYQIYTKLAIKRLETLIDSLEDQKIAEKLAKDGLLKVKDKRFVQKIFGDVLIDDEEVIPNKEQKPHSLAAAYVDIDRRLNDLNETVLDHDERIYGLERGKTEEDEFPF